MSKGETMHLDLDDLAAYQDRSLDAEERARATAHLADCLACRERLSAGVRAAARVESGRGWLDARRGLLIAAMLAGVLIGVGVWNAASERGGANVAATDPGTKPAVATNTGTSSTEAPAEDAAPDHADPRPEAEEAGSGDALPSIPPTERGVDPELLALRGGTKRVGSKVFRLAEGAWVDSAYGGGEVVELTRRSKEYRAAAAEHPVLDEYGAVGPTVVVVVDSISFRILPGPDRP